MCIRDRHKVIGCVIVIHPYHISILIQIIQVERIIGTWLHEKSSNFCRLHGFSANNRTESEGAAIGHRFVPLSGRFFLSKGINVTGNIQIVIILGYFLKRGKVTILFYFLAVTISLDIKAVMAEIKELEAKRAELDKEIEVYLKELGLVE